MNKNSLITLIYKELYELKVLANGFSEMEVFPKSLVDLAVDKTKSIAECLQKLPLNINRQQEPHFNFAQHSTADESIEPPFGSIWETQAKSQEETTKRVEDKVEILKEPIIEEEFEEETLDEQQEFEEEIEIMETQPEVVVQQSKIEVAPEDIPPPVQENIPPKIESPVAKPVLQNKVSDSKQPFSISIADRFRFQREIFDGNGEKFSKSLAEFNEMTTLKQAQNYITNNLKLDLKVPAVQAFIDILKRKLI